jgi:hypothetical protein
MADLARMLMGLGLLLLVLGAALWGLARFGFTWPGRLLPGDVLIERPGFTFSFPIVTSIVVSVVLSLLLYLLRR